MNFEEAQQKIMQLKHKPNNTIMLQVYGLFKQATVGDTNIERPGVFDLKGKAKWDSWQSMYGMSSDEAIIKYINLVQSLIDTIGLE